MKRIALTDGSSRWFDLSKADGPWDEAGWWDGHNNISRATGTQWDHEELYRTAGGKWVLHSWSQRQGTSKQWELIDEKTAAAWLVTNEHEPHAGAAEEFAALEIS